MVFPLLLSCVFGFRSLPSRASSFAFACLLFSCPDIRPAFFSVRLRLWVSVEHLTPYPSLSCSRCSFVRHALASSGQALCCACASMRGYSAALFSLGLHPLFASASCMMPLCLPLRPARCFLAPAGVLCGRLRATGCLFWASCA